MPRFRTGTKVGLNVYDGDRPIFQAHSEESAAELVALLNAGASLIEATPMVRQLTDDPGPEGDTGCLLSLSAGVMLGELLDLLRDAQSTLSAPETASEPSDALEGAQNGTDDPVACSWVGTGGRCVEPPAGLWERRNPRPLDVGGPSVRIFCAIHGREMEDVGWGRYT